MTPRSEDHIIPLSIAQEFLLTFGISERTKMYERWLRPDGFKLEDFPQVLDSPFIFDIDWRAVLEEEVPRILDALSRLGCNLTFEPTDDVSGVLIAADGRKVGIRYVPSESDGFEEAIAGFQQLVPREIEFRESPDNRDNDSFVFAALKREQWKHLESIDNHLLRHFFIPIDFGPSLPANLPTHDSSRGVFDSLFRGPKGAWLKILGAAAAGALLGLKVATEMKDDVDRIFAIGGAGLLGAFAAGLLVYKDWSLARRQHLGRPSKPLSSRFVGCLVILGYCLGGIALFCAVLAGAIKAWHWLFGLLI